MKTNSKTVGELKSSTSAGGVPAGCPVVGLWERWAPPQGKEAAPSRQRGAGSFCRSYEGWGCDPAKEQLEENESKQLLGSKPPEEPFWREEREPRSRLVERELG